MNAVFKKLKKVMLLIIMMFTLWVVPVLAESKGYQGTDDLIDKKMQQEVGIKAKKPFIDISKGNLGLFVFALGGFVAGVTVGYNWRKIFIEKAGK